MKRLLAGLATAGLVGSGASPATEFTWLETLSLESHLGDRTNATILASDFVSRAYSLCAVGSYTSELPAGYETAQRQLDGAGLLPVDEGSGLIFSVDANQQIKDVLTLSVWPDTVMLKVAEPVCIPATSAELDLSRRGSSIVLELQESG